MDDGVVEISDHAVDTFVDEFLKNTRTCSQTHTCNPPGPDAAHTHTCYHTHTQVLPSEDDDGAKNKEHSVPRPQRRRPSRNREAVRKYREKKKAHTAYLEEEFLRLRSLFLDLRGKIDHELGAFPFQNQCKTSSVLTEDLPCFCSPVGSSMQASIGTSTKAMVPLGGNCQPAVIDCQANTNEMAGAVQNSTHSRNLGIIGNRS
ncbi:unnamed protein product [Prunus armeniaca]|uniref:BZIP domain-containing protein n=1 Tax=Prunus armeniaca TaxID=36596 RepID=A0A6J5TWV6_PRUAR|nr:unnamed protein product [Prunus armeniaca]